MATRPTLSLQDIAEKRQNARLLDDTISSLNGYTPNKQATRYNTQEFERNVTPAPALPYDSSQIIQNASNGYTQATTDEERAYWRGIAERERNKNGYATSADGSVYTRLDPVRQAITPTMLTANDFAKKFGLTIDSDAIYDKFKNAVDTEYDVKDQELNKTMNEYAATMGQTEKSISEAMRNAANTSVMTGAAKASQDVAALTQSLGLQQQSVAGATDLAAQRAMLGEKKGAAYGQAEEQAFTQAQALKQALAGLGVQQDANQWQGYVSDVSYDSQIDTNRTTERFNRFSDLAQLEGQYDTNTKNRQNELDKNVTDILKQALQSETSLTETEIKAIVDKFGIDAGMWNTENAPRYGGGGGGLGGSSSGASPAVGMLKPTFDLEVEISKAKDAAMKAGKGTAAWNNYVAALGTRYNDRKDAEAAAEADLTQYSIDQGIKARAQAAPTAYFGDFRNAESTQSTSSNSSLEWRAAPMGGGYYYDSSTGKYYDKNMKPIG